MNTMTAAELLIEKIKKDYKDDIALVVMMGSRLYNDTHKKSDLDLYFVPKTKRGEQLGFVFIIDGIGFDFWPISWERMERIANFDERIPAIISEGKVLYYGSNEDLARFTLLKEKIDNNLDDYAFYEKARNKFKDVYEPFYAMLQDDKYIAMVRLQGVRILYALIESIALLNKSYIKRGRKHLKSEILAMEYIPDRFEELYDLFFTENDPKLLIGVVSQLISETKQMIDESVELREPKSFKDSMKGFYEEIINHYNKIERACEIGDTVTALLAAAEINIEMEWAFKDTEEIVEILPGMLPAYHADDLSLFCKRAKMHHNRFLKLLDQYDVDILHFADFNGLKDYLDLL